MNYLVGIYSICVWLQLCDPLASCSGDFEVSDGPDFSGPVYFSLAQIKPVA